MNFFSSSTPGGISSNPAIQDGLLLTYLCGFAGLAIILYREPIFHFLLRKERKATTAPLSFLDMFFIGVLIIPIVNIFFLPVIVRIFIPLLVILITLIFTLAPYVILGELYENSKETLFHTYSNIRFFRNKPKGLFFRVISFLLNFPFAFLLFHIFAIDFLVNIPLSRLLPDVTLIGVKLLILILTSELYLKSRDFVKIRVKRMEKYTPGYIYWNMGLVHHSKGEYKRTLEYLDKSYLYNTNKSNHIALSYTLVLQIITYVDLGLIQNAETYYDELNQLKENNARLISTKLVQFTEGYLLKFKTRLQAKVKALEIFTSLSKDRLPFSYFDSLCLYSLCELLIFELQSTGDENVLNEVKSTLNKVQSTSQRKESPLLLIRTLQLTSKFSLIEGEAQTADDVLTQALSIAEEHGIFPLIESIQKEKKAIQSEMEKWMLLIKRNASLKEKIEQASLLDYVSTALKVVDEG